MTPLSGFRKSTKLCYCDAAIRTDYFDLNRCVVLLWFVKFVPALGTAKTSGHHWPSRAKSMLNNLLLLVVNV